MQLCSLVFAVLLQPLAAAPQAAVIITWMALTLPSASIRSHCCEAEPVPLPVLVG
jgi:hypothetical protein